MTKRGTNMNCRLFSRRARDLSGKYAALLRRAMSIVFAGGNTTLRRFTTGKRV